MITLVSQKPFAADLAVVELFLRRHPARASYGSVAGHLAHEVPGAAR
jgi:hypothetical protein